MAGFLYFKPLATAPVTREELAALGLGYAFPKSVACCECRGEATPAGSAGRVFADPARMGERPVAVRMSEQRWRKLPGSQIHVGYWLDAPPTPLELARVPQLAGYPVQLAGGATWIIPLVRRFDRQQLVTTSNLPTYMDVDEDGNFHRGPVIERHAHLWEVTRPVADALLAEYVEGAAPPELSDEAIARCVATLLAENYVVGPGELALMRALSSEASTHAAAMAACDWPTFIDWADEQKKSASQ